VTPVEAAVVALVGASVLFSLVAVVGFVRLPDVFARAHAASKSETLGALFGLLAAAVAFGLNGTTLKLALLAVFILVTGPTAAHAIVRAAALGGATPWTRSERADGSVNDRSDATGTGTGSGASAGAAPEGSR
jgi:multicomponent Na+:H+ antiporter subunit G